MRVLVTGGCGFVGSHLVERFLDIGHEVLILDNFASGRRDTFAASRPNLEVVEMTIADRTGVDRAFDRWQPALVVHCAASYKDPDNWAEDIATNVLGTANVVRAAQRTKVRRLVYFQTALCYGSHPAELPVTLDHPLRPDNSYAISKTGGEQYIALSGLDFVSFRLANIYGPRNISGPIPTFYSRLAAGKTCFAVNTRRDFVFIDDLLRVVLQATAGEGPPGYYHLSTGGDYSIKELYDAVSSAMGVDRPVEERQRSADDAPTILLDPSKARSTFGWTATVPLEAGIRKAVRWYEAHAVGETYTHLKLEN